jgi:hypothetical protein
MKLFAADFLSYLISIITPAVSKVCVPWIGQMSAPDHRCPDNPELVLAKLPVLD